MIVLGMLMVAIHAVYVLHLIEFAPIMNLNPFHRLRGNRYDTMAVVLVAEKVV